MKWTLVVILAVMLVIVGVVYLGRQSRPPVPSPVPHQEIPTPTKGPSSRKTPTVPTPIDISGPLKNRKLVYWVLPKYPEWAERQGVMGMSQFKVRVTPSGLVMANLEPQLMNNDLRLDDEAAMAIRQWRFEEKPNAFGEQWGIVTIRFTLLAGMDEPSASLKGVRLARPPASGAWECVKKWLGGAKDEFVYICKLRSSAAER